MQVLRDVTPQGEQLRIINNSNPGIVLIRGAAGSGKTTSAVLRLKFLVAAWRNRRERLGHEDPVRVIVWTFNRTLRGYIKELTRKQIKAGHDISLELATFGRWSVGVLGNPLLINDQNRSDLILRFGRRVDLETRFLHEEVEYALGRFLPDSLDKYLTVKREGRGLAPRVDQDTRQQILDDIIAPYTAWKKKRGLSDWNDLAVRLAGEHHGPSYDVAIVDEAQDFSANQIRAVKNHLAPDHSVTFILDAAQRIYPRFLTWKGVGLTIPPGNIYRLKRNYRNTKEIAAFAKPLLEDLDITDDGTLPDFSACTESGDKPIVLHGKYSDQLAYTIGYIKKKVNLKKHTAVFLHMKGGGWFRYTREALRKAGLPYIELTREEEWPSGPENIALSTLHSAKGLEFDYVFLLGLASEVAPHGKEKGDTELETLRRLLAMAIGRGRKMVVLGTKPDDASGLVGLLDPDTYTRVDLG